VVSVQLVTLTTSSDSIDYNESITVTWNLPTAPVSSSEVGVHPGGASDWVGIFRDGSPNKTYSYYQWTSSHPSGSATFTAPSVPGNYVFRYFVNRSYTLVGSSKPFVVGPSFQLIPVVGEKNQVKINVQQTFGKPCTRSWIGLYDPTKANNAYITYENVGDKKEIQFTVPKAGIWEFRMFPLRAYDHVASCKVDVNGDTKLALSVVGAEVVLNYNVSTLDPKTDRVWFGIYSITEQNSRYYRRFQYISDTSVGEKRMKVLKTAGTYEARLFAHGTTAVICRSNTITIPAPDPTV